MANGWKKLLYDIEPEFDSEGFEVNDYSLVILKAGENASEDDILKWLEEEDDDPGHQT
jgi:hypothetical protein